MKTLSYLLNLHIHTKAPGFLKLYKYVYGGESFAVYRRKLRYGEENVTIWRTSEKCIRLLRTSYTISGNNDITQISFRTIADLIKYLNLITPY